MKKKGVIKRIMVVVLIVLSVIDLSGVCSMASEVDTINYSIKEYVKPVNIKETNVPKKPSALLSQMGTISVKKNLAVGDIDVPLYVTFDSPEDALQDISTNPAILAIKNAYILDDISNNNWTEYYDAMNALLDSDLRPSWYCENDISFRALRKFFDIYENDKKNLEIISQVADVKTIGELAQNQEILQLLPYDSFVTLSQETDALKKSNSLAKTTILGFDVDDGVKYAGDHAENPNSTDYKVFSSDCTNFASQILENGGIAQVKYDDEAKGWWHTKSTVLFVPVHDHSISWIRADTFAKYMGVGYSTKNHGLFSSNIEKGDFIAADFEDDGDWNHMGFVTDKKTSKTNGYYNYRVAQHTSNYHEWASSSKNNWDTIGSDGGKYGRVRR